MSEYHPNPAVMREMVESKPRRRTRPPGSEKNE
jgi:hypothetical protein